MHISEPKSYSSEFIGISLIFSQVHFILERILEKHSVNSSCIVYIFTHLGSTSVAASFFYEAVLYSLTAEIQNRLHKIDLKVSLEEYFMNMSVKLEVKDILFRKNSLVF